MTGNGNGRVDEAAVYAAAYVLLQGNKADQALQVLGELGDKKLIDGVAGAWTNADYGKAAAAIMDAVVDPSVRYLKGKDTGYLPDPNAFCLLDALDMLSVDTDAKFYPRHKAFNYKRIGVPSKQVEGYPVFMYDMDVSCGMADLVWNEDRLNLSMRATIKGTIELPDGWQALSLPNPYPCVVYRNYTIIKDGVLNVTHLPVSMSAITWDILLRNGMISGALNDNGSYVDGKWHKDTKWLVDFTAVPLINLGIASGNVLAEDLCKLMLNVYKTGGIMKVLKKKRDVLDPNQEIKTDVTLTPEQEMFLESVGVKRGAFSPPTEKGESTDVYLAKEFRIAGKGFSSLPKVEDVEEKIRLGKKMTASQLAIAEGLEWFDKNQPGTTVEETVAWIDEAVRTFRRVQTQERAKVQRAKFGIILNKKWFPDLTARDGAQLEVDDITFTFNIKDVEVAY
jgi:hypothetical protein